MKQYDMLKNLEFHDSLLTQVCNIEDNIRHKTRQGANLCSTPFFAIHYNIFTDVYQKVAPVENRGVNVTLQENFR